MAFQRALFFFIPSQTAASSVRVAANCFHTHLQCRINSSSSLKTCEHYLVFSSAVLKLKQPKTQPQSIQCTKCLEQVISWQSILSLTGMMEIWKPHRLCESCWRWLMCNLHALKDSDALELMEIIALAFFLLGSPPMTQLKRKEDLRPNLSVKGYFAEGKSFLLQQLERDRSSSQQWILWWDIPPPLSLVSWSWDLLGTTLKADTHPPGSEAVRQPSEHITPCALVSSSTQQDLFCLAGMLKSA